MQCPSQSSQVGNMSRRKQFPSIQSLERRALLSAATQIDLSFGQGGYVYTRGTDTIYDLAVQPDGKLLAAGIALVRDPGDFGLARYHPDGSLDTTFGKNGIASADIRGEFDRAYAITVLADGRILVAGESDRYDSSNADRAIALARFNPNGTLDTSFGTNGIFCLNDGQAYSEMRGMTVAADGSILLASGAKVLRLTVDGALDGSFGNGGILSAGQDTTSIAALSNGQFLVSAVGQTGLAVARYNADGSLDATYGVNGICSVATLPKAQGAQYEPGYNDYRVHGALQSDGKFVLSTPCTDGATSYFTLLRFTADGALDMSFSGDGRSDLKLGTFCSGMDVAIAPDGKIVQSGMIDSNFAAVRYNADGTLDDSFGYHGVAGANLGGTVDAYWWGYAEACTVAPNGDVYLGGSEPNQCWFAVLKFADDPTYTIANNGGILIRGTEGNDRIFVHRSGDNLLVDRNGVVTSVRGPLGVLVTVEAGAGDDLVVIDTGVGPAIVYGGDGKDTLVGGDYADSLYGNAGKDRIDGGGGNDRVAGNGGNDQLLGGEGLDRIYGDAGNDVELGCSGADRIWGGAGDDLLSGNGGNDMLSGETGVNTLSGGAGNDRLYSYSTDVLATGGQPTVKLVDEQTGLITLLEILF
jgi:uncharacterized delta-60 repeat protein